MIEVGSFVRFMEGQEFNAPATIRYLSLKVVEINGDVAIITLLVDTKDVGGFPVKTIGAIASAEEPWMIDLMYSTPIEWLEVVGERLPEII
ncbi:MAG: hypothetical protein H6546_07520 [Chitinophagales bacterium]|nr:hypothetical protein [Chitinophagales bacterium]MCP5415070.1 hypothetical protein [Chromatiaceae bacterium]